MVVQHETPNIAAADLDPVVRSLCGGELTGDWSVEPVGTSIGLGTVGIHRFRGSAATDDGSMDWSVILKAVSLQHRAGETEYEFFSSGAWNKIGAGLRPARCYGTQRRSDDECWIWLEDLDGAVGLPWSLDVVEQVARNVGQFHGSTAGVEQQRRWNSVGLYEGALRNYRFQETVAKLDQVANDEISSPVFGSTGPEKIERLFADADTVVAALNEIPWPVAHNDCHARNLFPFESGGQIRETVAIDWSGVGYGPIGEDAGNMVAALGRFFDVPADQLAPMADSAYEAFLEGIREARSGIPEDQVRLGYVAGLGMWGMAKLFLGGWGASSNPKIRNASASGPFGPQKPTETVRRWGAVTDALYPYAVECVERSRHMLEESK